MTDAILASFYEELDKIAAFEDEHGISEGKPKRMSALGRTARAAGAGALAGGATLAGGLLLGRKGLQQAGKFIGSDLKLVRAAADKAARRGRNVGDAARRRHEAITRRRFGKNLDGRTPEAAEYTGALRRGALTVGRSTIAAGVAAPLAAAGSLYATRRRKEKTAKWKGPLLAGAAGLAAGSAGGAAVGHKAGRRRGQREGAEMTAETLKELGRRADAAGGRIRVTPKGLRFVRGSESMGLGTSPQMTQKAAADRPFGPPGGPISVPRTAVALLGAAALPTLVYLDAQRRADRRAKMIAEATKTKTAGFGRKMAQKTAGVGIKMFDLVKKYPRAAALAGTALVGGGLGALPAAVYWDAQRRADRRAKMIAEATKTKTAAPAWMSHAFGRAKGLAGKTQRTLFGTRTRAAGTLAAGAGLAGAGAYAYNRRKRGKPMFPSVSSMASAVGSIPAKIRNSKVFQTLVRKTRQKFPDVPEAKVKQLVYEAMKEKGVTDKVAHVTSRARLYAPASLLGA